MPFYKSRDATISERLTGISIKEGFEAARKLVLSGRLGINQKEASSWLRKKQIKRDGLKVLVGIVGVLASFATISCCIFFRNDSSIRLTVFM